MVTYTNVHEVHGNYLAECTPDGMRARVCDTYVVGNHPGIRHVVATFEGETAWNDSARMAKELHEAEDPLRSPAPTIRKETR